MDLESEAVVEEQLPLELNTSNSNSRSKSSSKTSKSSKSKKDKKEKKEMKKSKKEKFNKSEKSNAKSVQVIDYQQHDEDEIGFEADPRYTRVTQAPRASTDIDVDAKGYTAGDD